MRRGFTLIELLVVIALLLVLIGLVVMFLPSALDSDKAARGGTMLQQALQISRTRAVRDQRPHGIRLVPDANGFVREVQYIEQPDDFSGGILGHPYLTPLPNYSVVRIVGVDFQTIINSIQPDDYLEVFGGGQAHRITRVDQSVMPGADKILGTADDLPPDIYLASPLPAPGILVSTTTYRIMRRARPTGEDVLQLPSDVAVDLNASIPNTAMDILFAPGGQVIFPRTASDFVALWVRDVSGDGATPAPDKYFLGEPSIIGVYVRSGAVAAQDPDRNSSDPYAFLRDGRSSGK